MSRQKAAAFLEVEKLAMANIIHDYRSVLENKATNAASSNMKKTVWTEVGSRFNARGGMMKLN